MLHGRKKPNKKRGAHSISQNGFFDVAYQPLNQFILGKRGCEQRVENRDIRVPTAKLRPIHINGNAKVRCNNKLNSPAAERGGAHPPDSEAILLISLGAVIIIIWLLILCGPRANVHKTLKCERPFSSLYLGARSRVFKRPSWGEKMERELSPAGHDNRVHLLARRAMRRARATAK
jgi:hypothetical protein